MLAFLKDPIQRGWAVLAVLAVLALALIVPLAVNAEDRHLTAFRPGDEDASAIRETLEGKADVQAYLSTPHQLDDIKDPTQALLVILGAERRYSEGESQAIIAFLERGGRVLLADEGGYGTDVALAAGFGFRSTHLVDTHNHRGDPTLVVATAKVEDRAYSVLFNAPISIHALQDANPHEVLAKSSAAVFPDGSYLDSNGNGEVDISDGASPDDGGFSLIVRTTVGSAGGILVLVADTGLFMNEQAAVVDFQNEEYVADLVGTLVPRDGVIILDESRHAPAPMLAAYDNAVRSVGRATSGDVAPYVTLALVLLATLVAWYATRETEDWSHHEHNLGVEANVPEDVRPDLSRAQRMARRRISERFNIPLEQVAAMPAEQLFTLTGDRSLSEAAAGTLRSDPAPLFRQFSEATR